MQRSWSWRFSTWLDPPSTCFNTMWINWGKPTRSLFALDNLPLYSQISGKYQIIASDQFMHIINHLSTQQAGLCVITSILQPDHFFIARIADDDDGDCIESIRSLERSLLGFPMAAIFHRPSEFASGRQRTPQPPSPNASTQLAATMLGRWTTKIGEVYFWWWAKAGLS